MALWPWVDIVPILNYAPVLHITSLMLNYDRSHLTKVRITEQPNTFQLLLAAKQAVPPPSICAATVCLYQLHKQLAVRQLSIID